MIAIAASLVLVAMILLSRLIRRDPDVRSTKFGWYIERERYSDDEPPGARDDADTQQWPRTPSS